MKTRFLKKKIVLAGVVLIGISIAATIALTYRYSLKVRTEVKNSAEFAQVIQSLENSLNRFTNGLQGVAGASHATNHRMTAQNFLRYAESREFFSNFPGSLGFGFIRPVPQRELKSYLAKQRALNPGFHASDLRLITPPDGLHFFIEMIEPDTRNRHARGLDISSEPNRQEAALRAMKTGRPALTRKIHLVQAGEDQSGFLYLLPIYQMPVAPAEESQRIKSLVGFAYTPILAAELIRPSLKATSPGLGIRVFQDDDRQPENLIYETPTHQPNPPTWKAAIYVGEQKWLVQGFAPTSTSFYDSYNFIPALLFLIVTLLTFGLAAYLIQLGREENFRIAAIDIARKEVEQSQAELRSQREFLQTVIDGLPTLIGYWDKDLINRLSNSAYREYFGKDHTEIHGRHIRELLPPEVFEKNRPYMEGALRGETQIFERDLLIRSGEVRSTLANYIPHFKDGAVIGFFVIVMDISVVKKLEAELWANNELRRAILESTRYAVISADRSGVIHTFNKAAEDLLGYRASEIIGHATPALFHDPSEIAQRARELTKEFKRPFAPGFECFVARAQMDLPDEAEWTYVRKDGSRVSVRLSVTALRNAEGELVGFVGIAQDITEEKRIRVQLLQANDQALAAARVKSEFLANMSHEIRTPMNGVIGMCDLLLDSVTDPGQIERLRIIQQCGNSLLDLVNDILDFSKIESDKIEIENEAFNPHQVASDVVELLGPLASQKGLSLSYKKGEAVPGWIVGDVTRFRQILMNLVSNAVKFTSMGSVQVLSSATSLDDGRFDFQFSVKDTGIGISREAQARLFSPFSQADASTTRRFGGSGLGLAICKGLCERMGGRIWIESEAGRGSTFSFSIPVREAIEPARNESSSTVQGFTNLASQFPHRILVVEDNRTNQLVVCGMLSKLGYESDIAKDGVEALGALDQTDYDLVLMDCHMPELDGFETTRLIRSRRDRSQPRIVAVTASAMQDDIHRCQEVGMDDVISKPISLGQLIGVLKSDSVLRGDGTTAQNQPERDLPVMNEDVFFLNFTGLEDLAYEAIGQILSLLPQMMSEVQKAVETPDPQAITFASHSLKGAIANLHAERAVEAAARLEEVGRLAELSSIAPAYAKLRHEIEVLEQHLNAKFPQKRGA